MAKYPFLSDEWFTAVRELHESHPDAVPPEVLLRMNLKVTETPFGGDRMMHMAADGGKADWGHGHVDDADVTLTLGYDVAKEIFVGGNPQAAIEAFMGGKITIQGDITKLMVMQASGPGPGAAAFALALLQITE